MVVEPDLLPAPLEHEKRLAEIEAELTRVRKKLGPAALLARYAQPEKAEEIPIPSLLDSDVKPAPRKKDTKFAEFDALEEAGVRVEINTPKSERDIGNLRLAIEVTLNQLDEFDNAKAIYQRALKDRATASFAVARLARLDRNLAIKLLRHLDSIADHRGEKAWWATSLKLLEQQSPQSAAKSRSVASVRAAQLAILLDSKAIYEDRRAALEYLVPESDPNRDPNPAIDSALLKILAQRDGVLPEGLPLVVARRLGVRSWQELLGSGRGGEFGIPHLPALTFLAQRNPDRFRAELGEMLATELQATHGNLDAILWSIWQLDLRDLTPDLERIATSGPKDYDGYMTRGSSNRIWPVTHRYHRARHIVSMWKEEDPLCRAKLVVAFGYANANRFDEGPDGSIEHFRDQLRKERARLNDEQRESLADFVEWCDANAAARLKYATRAKAFTKVSKNVREALELGQ
jgi:hypothetical protein